MDAKTKVFYLSQFAAILDVIPEGVSPAIVIFGKQDEKEVAITNLMPMANEQGKIIPPSRLPLILSDLAVSMLTNEGQFDEVNLKVKNVFNPGVN